jgi:hypothetical protein
MGRGTVGLLSAQVRSPICAMLTDCQGYHVTTLNRGMTIKDLLAGQE